MCLYVVGLNLSNRQIARELGLNDDDVQAMASHLRDGLVAKTPPSSGRARSKPTRSMS